MTTNAQSPTHIPTSLRRSVTNILKGAAGNTVEWYDVYTYTVFVSYFEHHFFNAADKNSTVYAYAVFAITFLMRPVGAWAFGRYADRRGRRAALTASITLMAACSFVISVAPTNATIGGWATVLLIAMRLVQGFATGGEYGTNATYLSEASVASRRGFLSSFQYVTLVLGHVLAQATLLIMLGVMGDEEIAAWGWRIPFFIGGIAAVVVWWARRTMDESLTEESLTKARSKDNRDIGTVRELFRHHSRGFFAILALSAGGTLAFYGYSVNGPAIIKTVYADQPALASTLNLTALILLMLMVPIAGLMSDIVGRKAVYLFFCFGALIYTYFLYTWLPQTTTPWLSLLILGVGFAFLSAYAALAAIIKAEFFPARIRALGVGLSHNLGNSIFGGTAPLLYAYFNRIDLPQVFIIYMLVILACSAIASAIFLPGRKTVTELDKEQGHAFGEPTAAPSDAGKTQ